MSGLRIGLVGCGRWGSNFARTLQQMEGCELTACCDPDNAKTARIAKANRWVKTYREPASMLRESGLDAVVVATPAVTHCKVACEAMKAGAHVLVEKPLATSTEECRRMIDQSRKSGRILMVGHIFHYNRAVQRLNSIIKEGSFGSLRYLYSVRTNLGPIRGDVNVLWDLAAHDVSIFLHLTGDEPAEVTASGQSYLRHEIADVAFGTVYFRKTKVLGHLHVSWLDPHKMRRLTVIGTKQMAVLDDVDPQEPIRVYNRGVAESEDKAYDDFGHFQLVLRDGDISVPHVAMEEPLRTEVLHFLECINEKKKPLTDGEHGLAVVGVLEALDKSLKSRGRPVKVR